MRIKSSDQKLVRLKENEIFTYQTCTSHIEKERKLLRTKEENTRENINSSDQILKRKKR